MGVIPANAERNWETIQDRFHKIFWLFVASKINKGINESKMLDFMALQSVQSHGLLPPELKHAESVQSHGLLPPELKHAESVQSHGLLPPSSSTLKACNL